MKIVKKDSATRETHDFSKFFESKSTRNPITKNNIKPIVERKFPTKVIIMVSLLFILIVALFFSIQEQRNLTKIEKPAGLKPLLRNKPVQPK